MHDADRITPPTAAAFRCCQLISIFADAFAGLLIRHCFLSFFASCQFSPIMPMLPDIDYYAL